MWVLPVGSLLPSHPKKKRMWEIPFPLPSTGKGGILGLSMSLWLCGPFPFPGFRNSLLQVRGRAAAEGVSLNLCGFPQIVGT